MGATMKKIQNDIARRVADTNAASLATVNSSDVTRVHSQNTLDLAVQMKMELLRVRATERKSTERAKKMSDTLLRMGSNAMSGAAKVASASDETLGTPEPATDAEEAVEADVTNAAREYGTVTNETQEKKEEVVAAKR